MWCVALANQRYMPMSNIRQDAAAAALFTACKVEDTLKKSKDILCAAYNLKVTQAEQVSSDDPVGVPALSCVLYMYRGG